MQQFPRILFVGKARLRDTAKPPEREPHLTEDNRGESYGKRNCQMV